MLKYYIEFVHKNSDEELYDMQTKWFDSEKEAKDWLHNNFDYICKDVSVCLMTVKVLNEDEYDIIKSQKLA